MSLPGKTVMRVWNSIPATIGGRLAMMQARAFDVVCVIGFVLALVGCRATEDDPDLARSVEATERAEVAQPMGIIDLPTELDRVLRGYEAGWRANDADALALLFTDEGFILRPGHTPVRGRAEIAEAYTGSGGPLHLHAFEYAVEDSIGYIIGGFRSAPERPDAGKFILTLRRFKDGKWYITADMDNGNWSE
jgi:ketosteroid isomerase-like protein